MLLLSNQWRRWRRSLSLHLEQMSVVPWLFLLIVVQANGQFPTPPQNMYNHHPPPPPGPQGMTAQPFLTGPSNAPPNHYYQIDSNNNRLVQRQIPPGPGGLTAAATNYLLQQLQNERQQQQMQHRSMQPQQQAMSPQQQTLQLLANLTPQQIAALQQVIPTLPRSNQQQGGPHEEHHGGPSPRVPMSAFASRIGPFDKLFNRAKSWLPDMMSAGSSMKQGGGGGSGDGVGEPKMRDMHRLPKPPQYPLYDLPSMGQATPPPAPVMHPMASLPNSAFDLDQPQMGPPMQSSSPRSAGPMSAGSNFNQQNWISPGPTMATSRRSRPVPQRPKPSKPSFLRNPLGRSQRKPRPSQEPPVNYNRRNHGPPPKGRQPPPPRSRGRNPAITTRPKKVGPPRGRGPPAGGRRPPPPSSGPTSDPYGTSGPGGSQNMGFDHPMASNLSPAQSPSLGRPLSYEEYMARPSHSYTNDPWNFDPFASQMNQGLHTHALRYNYDPLGMNALDTEANSHLDPNKLSYPGDSFNQEMVKDSPGIGASAQIGGWDKPYKKRTYDSDPESELTPPGVAYGGGAPPSFSSSPSDPFASIPSSLGSSSSNRYKNSGNNDNDIPPGGTGFMGEALSGGRLGEMPTTMDQFERGSAMQSYNNDGPPTIDLESLSQSPGDDGMDGLEFTIETSMDKGPEAMGSAMMEGDSPHPDHHPLGPMQPAANPYLSDQYNPYGDHSSPSQSAIPGSPYGPNGYRERERYGRRRTRNNHIRGPHPPPPRARRRSLKTSRPRPRKLIPHPPPTPQTAMPLFPSPTSIVPEGVQIFNEIIRPQIVQSNAPRHHHHHHQARHLPHPQQAVLRRTLYNAIRHSSKK